MSFENLLNQAKGNPLATAIVTAGLLIVASGSVASAVKEIRWWVYPDELAQLKVELQSEAATRARIVDDRDAKQEQKIGLLACDSLNASIQATRQTLRSMKADIEKSPTDSLYREYDKYQNQLQRDERRYDRECNR